MKNVFLNGCMIIFQRLKITIFEMHYFPYFTFFQILAQYCGIQHPIKTCFGTIRLVMKLPNFSIITSLSCHSPLVNYGINKLLVTAATGWTSLGIMTYPQGRAAPTRSLRTITCQRSVHNHNDPFEGVVLYQSDQKRYCN